jgi:hypothetical protein
MLICVGFAMQVYQNLDSSPPEPPKQSNRVGGLAQIEARMAQADLPAQEQPVADFPAEAPHVAPKAKPNPVKQNVLTTAGITGFVVLNLLRFIVGLANRVVIPFRKSPLQGVLFLIPPLTFVYIWRHWSKIRKPVGRVISPLVALAVVVVAYAFMPGLSRASRTSGSLQNRRETSVDILKGDVTRQMDKTTSDVKTLTGNLQRKLPGKLEKAKAAAENLSGRVQKNANSLKQELPRTLDEAQKTGERLRVRVEKAVDELRSPKKKGSVQPQSDSPSKVQKQP